MKVTTSYSMNRSRVERILGAFRKKKILVFGDVGVDKYTVGRVSRISPEAPIPIVEVTSTQLKLGLAANVADNVRALGGHAMLVGVIGKDLGAHDFKSLLRHTRIPDKHLISDGTRRTTLKERVVAESQQVVRIDHETQKKIDAKIIREVWNRLEKALSVADCVIIEDYSKGLVEVSVCRQLMAAAEERDIPVLVDPNSKSTPTIYQLVSGADIVEAALLANYAAGIEVGKRGTATVTIDELRDFMDFVGRRGRHRRA
ncbi:MAG: hypothetical protein HY075_04640 [Deltaproteobacteria bacterium]|nr:hypothetical protein [Deltaproteobacteria bacterium]